MKQTTIQPQLIMISPYILPKAYSFRTFVLLYNFFAPVTLKKAINPEEISTYMNFLAKRRNFITELKVYKLQVLNVLFSVIWKRSAALYGL